jgi:hypothetical protein
MLVGVTAHDAVGLCVAWLLMAAVGTIASYVPAAKRLASIPMRSFMPNNACGLRRLQVRFTRV